MSVVLQHAYRSPRDARRAGGDFALARRYRDGAITFIVTDLWAKGAEAEHYASCMQHAFDIISLTVLSPARMLSLLNRFLVEELQSRAETEGSASALVVNCDACGKLRYAAAGTDAALLFRGSDWQRQLEATGPLLGIHACASYFEQGFTFRFGDVLVLCTDGITEARDGGDRRALLGIGGLAEIMSKLIGANGLPKCDDLMEHVAAWIGGDFDDDATAVFASPQPADRTR